MKNFTIILLTLLSLTASSDLFSQNVAINSTGSNADASAMLDLSSTTSGFLMPRLTTTQRNAIVLPATGLAIFNSTVLSYQVNVGTPASPIWSTLSTSAWNLSGNSGTNSGSNFLGTSDNHSLSFSTNSIQRMYIDSSTGNVGVGTNTPGADFTLFQKSGNGASKGFRFTGNSIGGTGSGTGFALSLGYNQSANKQLWLGDPDYFGSSSGSFIRYQVISGVAVLDGVRGDASTRKPISIGVGGDANSGIILGADFNGNSPSSYVWANGNTAIGSGYRATSAPSNGLIVQGNTGIGTSTFNATYPEKMLVDAGATSNTNYQNVITGKGNTNSYVQLNIQNSNAGIDASSDVVATADNGSETVNFVDMGVNSSANSSTGVLGGANNSYLYSTGNDFSIGNATSAKSLILFTGGTAASNESMRIDGSGNVGVGSAAPSEKLDVTGNVKFSGALMPNDLAGAAGTFLTSNGAGTAPTWTTFDTTSIPSFSQKVRSLLSSTDPITYTNGLIGITQATTSTNGYLSSTDWNTFNSKGSGSVTSVSVVTANGVSGSVANATTTPAITVTLGAITPTSVAATGTVTGSNLSGTNTGNVTLGTANGLSLAGQALSLGLANTSTTGALSSTDWNTFNNKLTTVDTTNIGNFSQKVRSLFSSTAPITYSNGSIGITQATTSTNGFLSSTDWNTFNNKGSGSVTSVSVVSANGVSGSVATATTTPAITLTLGAITPSSVAASGTITGSNLSGTNTGNVTIGTANGLSLSGQALSLGLASTSTTGALSSTDWNAFNNKWSMGGNSVASEQNFGTTSNFDLPFLTNNTEKMRLTSTGRLGIGTAVPSYPLQVVAASDPLYLGGMQSGSNTDSLLTIVNGVVKRLSPSALTTSSSNAWALVGNSNIVSGTSFIGTTNNKSMRFRTNNVQRMIIDSTGNVGIGTSAFDPTLPEKLLVDAGTSAYNGPVTNSTPINAIGFSNGFQQIQVQNRAYGNYSSSDLVAASDGTRNGTMPFNTDAHYVDFGINSSGYTNNNSNILNQPYTAYLYSTTPQDFYVGNGYSGKDMIFFTNYGPTNSNNTADGFEILRLKGGTTQQVTIGNIAANGTNRLTVNGSISATAFNVSSDRRLKTNINGLQYGLKEILALQPVSYNWKVTPSTDKQLGLIAQDAKKVIPEIVSGNEDTGTLSINYSELVPVLINAIKEQQQQIDNLKKDIELLKNKK